MGTHYGPAGCQLAGRPGRPGTATVSTTALRCSCSVNHSSGSEPASHWTAVLVLPLIWHKFRLHSAVVKC